MITQIANQLRKLLPVLSVQRLLPGSAIHRELVLFKVKAETRETRDEIIQIANIFRASVIDVTRGSLTIELTGDSSKSAAMQKLYEEFGFWRWYGRDAWHWSGARGQFIPRANRKRNSSLEKRCKKTRPRVLHAGGAA